MRLPWRRRYPPTQDSTAWILEYVAPTLTYRYITAPWRALPGVYVLGAPKCGTTTLTELLWAHPAHVRPLTNELNYLQCLPGFASHHESNKLLAWLWGRYKNGHAAFSPLGYRKFFPRRAEMAQRRLQGLGAFTSDCDPVTLYCPIALERIRTLVPHAKCIISLRNPVDRVCSDYNMRRHSGWETRALEMCVEDELRDSPREFKRRFVHNSVYAPHVRRWLEAFPKSVLVLRAEDLFQSGPNLAREIYQFLGLPPHEIPIKPANVGQYKSALPRRLRDRLQRFFAPHNAELYALLGRDMGWD